MNLQRKVQAIRQMVSAKILYQIRLSDHGLEMVSKLGKLLRNEDKVTLYLPSWTGMQCLHHRQGRNIPNLLKTVMISRKKASEKMKLDTDLIAREVGDRTDPLNGERLQKIGLVGNNWQKIKEHQTRKSKEIIEGKIMVKQYFLCLRVRYQGIGYGWIADYHLETRLDVYKHYLIQHQTR